MAKDKKNLETTTPVDKEQEAQTMINDLVERSQKAFDKLRYYSQEQVDKICQAMALAAEEHHMDLAVDAANETGRGVLLLSSNGIGSRRTFVMIRLLVLSKTMMKIKQLQLLIRWELSLVLSQLLTQLQPQFSNPLFPLRHGTRSFSPSTLKL